MRKSTVLLAIGIASGPLAMTVPAAEPPTFLAAAGEAPAWEQLQYQRLDDADALETLQHTNPRHYAIARRILAAANEICNAGKADPIPVLFNAQNIACLRSLWMTSNPPKRQLSFRIDQTVYSALVTLTDMNARLEQIPRLEGKRGH
jgi:hypothetical protein